MIYKVSIGVNVDEGDLVAVAPQPKSEGVKYTRRTLGADGTIHQEGPYLELEYNALESAQQYRDLLAQFGLDAATTGPVTILARDEQYASDRYNGLAVRPEPGRDNGWSYFPRNVTILIRNLQSPV